MAEKTGPILVQERPQFEQYRASEAAGQTRTARSAVPRVQIPQSAGVEEVKRHSTILAPGDEILSHGPWNLGEAAAYLFEPGSGTGSLYFPADGFDAVEIELSSRRVRIGLQDLNGDPFVFGQIQRPHRAAA